MWRPVLEHDATLNEVETAWSLDDLLDYHDAKDAWIEASRKHEG